MERRYTIHGREGLIGTMLTIEDAWLIIQEEEPGKDPDAVLENAHRSLAHKTGSLTVIVVQPPRHIIQSARRLAEQKKNQSEVTNVNG